MKADWGWLREVNWGRLTLVFPIIAFLLCFMGMVWGFIDRRFVDGAVMATAAGVNLAMVLVILWYTRR